MSSRPCQNWFTDSGSRRTPLIESFFFLIILRNIMISWCWINMGRGDLERRKNYLYYSKVFLFFFVFYLYGFPSKSFIDDDTIVDERSNRVINSFKLIRKIIREFFCFSPEILSYLRSLVRLLRTYIIFHYKLERRISYLVCIFLTSN